MIVLQSINQGLFNAISVLGTVLAVVLNGFLVYLYRQQKDILERQTELTEAEQKSLPRIRTYRLFSWQDLYRYEQEIGEDLDLRGMPDRYSMFMAKISNSGKGFMKDVYAELVIETPSYRHSVSSALAHNTNMDQVIFSGEGGALAPEEGEVLMTSQFSFSREDIEEEIEESGISVDEPVSPSELLWILERIDETPVRIGVFVHYRDGTGIREPISLLATECELDRYADLREAWEWGKPIVGELNPVFNLEEKGNMFVNT